MFDQTIILEALRNGKDPQKIADEIAASLNSAIDSYKKETEAAKNATKKLEATSALINSILDYVETYYPELYSANLRDIDAKIIVKSLDEAYEESKLYVDLVNKISNSKINKTSTSKDPISDFLSLNNLI